MILCYVCQDRTSSISYFRFVYCFVSLFIVLVGFGDYVPTTAGGRVFTTLYVLSASTFLARTLLNLVTYPLSVRTRKSEKQFLTQFSEGLTKEQLKGIFQARLFDIVSGLQSKPEELNKAEFTLLLLNMMNKVDLKEVMVAANLFEKLDKSENGVITFDSLSQEIRDAPSQADLEFQRRISKEADIDQAISNISSKLSFSRLMSGGTGFDQQQDAIMSPMFNENTARAASFDSRTRDIENHFSGVDRPMSPFGYRRNSRASSRSSIDGRTL